jgi:hypothetical protein
MTRALTVIAAITAVLSTGCADQEGTDVGNPITAEFSLAEDGRVISDAEGAEFTIDRAELRIETLTFVLPEGEDCDSIAEQLEGNIKCEAGELSLPGNVKYDLLTGTPGRPIEVPNLAYPQVRFHIRGQGNEPGLRVWANHDDQRIDLRFGGIDEVVLQAPDAEAGVIFDARTWFGETDLLGCVAGGTLPEEGGAVVIDEEGGQDACAGLASVLEQRLVPSIR